MGEFFRPQTSPVQTPFPPWGPAPEGDEVPHRTSDTVASSAKEGSLIQKLLARLIGIPLAAVIIFSVWSILAGGATEINPDFPSVPSPTGSFTALGDLISDGFNDTSFSSHLWATLSRVLMIFFVALLLGIFIGGFAGINHWTRGIFDPTFSILRFFSPVLAVTVSIMNSGIEGDKVLPSALPSIFVVADGVSRALYRRASGYSYSQVDEVVGVVRTALLVTWIVVASNELFFASEGLFNVGYSARVFFRPNVLGAVSIVAVALALVMDSIVRTVGYLISNNR